MMQLEDLRQQNAKMIADANQRATETQTALLAALKEISADHKTVSENFKAAFDRSDETATRLSKMGLRLSVVALILAASTLFFPDGIPGVAIHDRAGVTATPQSTPSTQVVPPTATP